MTPSLSHIILLSFALLYLLPGYLADNSNVSSSNEQNDANQENSIPDTLWGRYKDKYNLNYEGDEDDEKKDIFRMNVLGILSHNLGYLKGEFTFKEVANKYADVDHENFVKTMNGYKPSLRSSRNFKDSQNGGASTGSNSAAGSSDPTSADTNTSTFQSTNNTDLPDTVDWRQQGAVTPPKDQGPCGSCYTFSATGALEGQNQISTGNLISLSEQNLVDCSQPEGDSGCDGGIMANAFQYAKLNGIDSEDSYPYSGQANETCMFNPNNVVVTATGVVNIPQGDENALKEAIATKGPVSIAIDASNPSFQFYASGIYQEPACNSDNVDHGVLAVGYGIENGTDYWLVKNSWGSDWGEGGYIRIRRNFNNHCGVASIASYPLVQ